MFVWYRNSILASIISLIGCAGVVAGISELLKDASQREMSVPETLGFIAAGILFAVLGKVISSNKEKKKQAAAGAAGYAQPAASARTAPVRSAQQAAALVQTRPIGKAAGLPLYRLLGGSNPVTESDITIAIDPPEKMARLAREYVKRGFRILKIKTGINPDEDIEAVRMIREAVGPDIRLRIDANQGYDLCTACRVLEELKKLGVESAEQPLPRWDIDGMAELRKQVHGIAIMADESVHGIYDAHRVIRACAADVINIKLMKSGGIYPALKICAAAEAAGIPCMLGCMDDMKIAITAALSLFSARRNIREADLDSFHFCVDPELGMKGGFTYEGGLYTLTEKPGLGIDFDFDAL